MLAQYWHSMGVLLLGDTNNDIDLILGNVGSKNYFK